MLRLSTLGAIKEDPEDRIIREVLEPVDFARWRKQEVTGLERLTARRAGVIAFALDNYINLVARMRLLRVNLLR